jgi:hypothetical protein
MGKKKIGFNLVGIDTKEFATFEESFDSNNIENIDLNINIGFQLSDNLDIINCVFTINFLQKENVLIKLKLSCTFSIDESTLKSFKKDNKIIFPKPLMSHFGVITVGAARGVLHAKTDGSIFNDLVLPTVNLTEMITEDIVFEIESNQEIS